MTYVNRKEAGQRLAQAVKKQLQTNNVVVLALPLGGVILGLEVARTLDASSGLVITRKISHPAAPEYAIGVIAEDDKPVYDEQEVVMVDEEWLDQAVVRTRAAIRNQRKLYDSAATEQNLAGKTIVIVDEGMVSGLSMEAATRFALNKQTKQVIVAVPVASQASVDRLSTLADTVITVEDPSQFRGNVGAHYYAFEPLKDKEVCKLLREAHSGLQQPITANTTPVATR